ncbi:MAG: hypothetical protein ACFB2X_04040 [Rivularia sp. (in: cyanobacteria)]
MVKKIITFLMMSVGLFTLNSNSTLAGKPPLEQLNETFYPSVCTITAQYKKYRCNQMVIKGFRNHSSNINICDESACLSLVISPTQVQRIQNDARDFYVNKIFLQKGYDTTPLLNASIKCNSIKDGISCAGKFANDHSLVVNIAKAGIAQRVEERRNRKTPRITPSNIRTMQTLFRYHFMP